MKRAVAAMDDRLYAHIIDQCAANACREIHLHNFGEPLLDMHLEERIRYAKERGIRKVKMFCNGSLLNAARAEGLIRAGLDEIKISFDGATREEFEKIRVPLKFDRVVENVKRLVALRNELRSGLKIGIACCSTTDREATMRSVEKMVDRFSFGKVHNWASEEYAGAAGRLRKPCSRLWRSLTVLASGDVSLCCLDYDGQQLLGRIDATASIRDVFDGAAYRAVRRAHCEARQSEIELCRNCTKAFF
jgi:MoaA/NifB/PqqE/SkfB family radical SAM enzyme